MSRLANHLLCLTACGLLICAMPARAEQWVSLAKSANTTMSADLQSVEKDGEVRKVWVRYDYVTPLHEQNGANTIYIMAHHVMNCSKHTVGTEREVHYDRDKINGESPNLPMTKAAPGSFNEVLLKTVCHS